MKSHPTRILVPYFLAGSGHLVSARAIAHYIRAKKPDWDIRFIEPADEFNNRYGKCKKLYFLELRDFNIFNCYCNGTYNSFLCKKNNGEAFAGNSGYVEGYCRR